MQLVETRQQRLRRLLERYHDRALSFARSIARSRADGDDLLQEALVRAMDKLDSLREDAAFRGWLYRVIVSVHRNRYRRAFWQRLLPLTSEPASDDRPDEALGASDRARAALATLPHEQREAIVLHDLEGWRIDEIAELEGTSASAIKSRLSRGRDRLREVYTRRFAMRVATSLVPGETP
jgi:RNA polymerase sigma-70 factor (ECF subfamily)